ncbi:beta-ketoacyl synthase N-terminal-like domain-containing protein [Streptomyces sp. NPDC057654]|uniref:beta-ketoacyl synthase N-terminal-like domain-containing protein n=1 Tax=Streptomyces sp. NPDC057654 TaxID=3346196 RepID=UPI0036C39220
MSPTAAPRRVAVTGMGLISAAGVGAEANWKRVVAGEPTARRDPRLDGCPVDFDCRVPDFAPSRYLGQGLTESLDRYAQLAMVAAEEAMTSAGVVVGTSGRVPGGDSADGPASGAVDPTRIGVMLGSVAGGMATIEAQQTRLERHGPTAVAGRTMPLGLLSAAAGALSVRFGLLGATMTLATACASGTTAIGTARDLIRAGTLDIALVAHADIALWHEACVILTPVLRKHAGLPDEVVDYFALYQERPDEVLDQALDVVAREVAEGRDLQRTVDTAKLMEDHLAAFWQAAGQDR